MPESEKNDLSALKFTGILSKTWLLHPQRSLYKSCFHFFLLQALKSTHNVPLDLFLMHLIMDYGDVVDIYPPKALDPFD